MGDIYFLSRVDKSDRHCAFEVYSAFVQFCEFFPFFFLLIKSSMICESLMHWGFRIGFLYDYHVFLAEEFLRVGYPLVGSVFSEWR